jgi:hypothetical protein
VLDRPLSAAGKPGTTRISLTASPSHEQHLPEYRKRRYMPILPVARVEKLGSKALQRANQAHHL